MRQKTVFFDQFSSRNKKSEFLRNEKNKRKFV